MRSLPAAAAALLLGMLLGYGAAVVMGGDQKATEQGVSSAELGSAAVGYLSENLLKPGLSASAVNVSPYGSYLYRVDVMIKQGGRELQVVPVYITKDGQVLALQVFNLSEPLAKEAQRVSVTPDDDPAIGPEDAPVLMIEFSDYQCPYCRKFALETLKPLLERYRGKIRYVYRDFPLESIHPYALKAAEAANCAGEQGRYFEYHDILFERQKEWSGEGVDRFYGYAEELGLNVTRFRECLDSGRYEQEVRKDMQDAVAAGVRSTPTFFINGIMVTGAQPLEVFTGIIDRELEAAEGGGG